MKTEYMKFDGRSKNTAASAGGLPVHFVLYLGNSRIFDRLHWTHQ